MPEPDPAAELESRIARFEQGWRPEAPRAIDDALEAPPALDGGTRSRLLVELICVDLELRWRHSRVAEPIALAGYVERFPELIGLESLPLEVLGEEYRARRRWGDAPSHAAFLSRFAGRREPIREELARIDAELAAEAAGPRPAPGPRPVAAGIERVEGDAPLLSHRDFLLRRLIGAGRMGKVYEAHRRGDGREFAVKFLRKSFLHHPDVVRRFLGEARTVARLRHPNIVGTEGLGRTPAGAYFLVMERVAGPNLERVASRRVLAVEEVLAWAIETCAALEHAHERGVVHCDLKPANLLLDADGRIRVTDFGLARSLGEDTPWAAEVEGTAPFMAPEQASRCWGPIDRRTDVYGIGAVIFTLLTGRPPFVGRRLPDVLAQVLSAMPAVPAARLRPGLPGAVVELCGKCLSKPPEARFADAGEVRRALAGIRAAEP